MKKSLICMTAAAAMMFATVTSYASSYDTQKNAASFDEAAGKTTVLIYKGNAATPTAGNIVYVDQATSPFNASTNFLLKAGPTDGEYTVKFGSSDGTSAETSFFIGMIDTDKDVQLKKIDGTDGYKEVVDNGVTTYNIGYKATIDIENGYKSLIIKKGNSYMGCTLPSTLSGSGSAEIGIQINGASSLDEIEGAWLSIRGIETMSAEAAE